MTENFDFGTPDTTFDSQFNGGIAKVYRIHNMMNHVFQARSTDDHLQWKAALDSIYDEIWPYLDEKKDSITEIDKVKTACTSRVLNYIKWENSNLQGNMKNHIKQSKQVEVEIELGKYTRFLVRSLKNHNMDMPGVSDPTMAVMRGRY